MMIGSDFPLFHVYYNDVRLNTVSVYMKPNHVQFELNLVAQKPHIRVHMFGHNFVGYLWKLVLDLFQFRIKIGWMNEWEIQKYRTEEKIN